MKNVVIVDAIRTPIGTNNGTLASWHPADLGAATLNALVDQTGIDPALVDDVIFGCVTQIGAQSSNLARNVVLAAGWPETVPATTVDRQGASSEQALRFAAQGVVAGTYDLVVAAGVEAMSLVPLGAAIGKGLGNPHPDSLNERYAERGGLIPPRMAAETLANRCQLSRTQLDEYAQRSHQLAANARNAGHFDQEIVPLKRHGNTLNADEAIGKSSPRQLNEMTPSVIEDGSITAGNSAQIGDGAAALLIASESNAAKLGLKPRAKITSQALAGVDPISMLTGAIPATTKALARAGLDVADIDTFEVTENFAAVVLAWAAEHKPKMKRINPNGGSIALGDPLGCSGLRALTTLLHQLERTEGRYGLQTGAALGGLATATIIERT